MSAVTDRSLETLSLSELVHRASMPPLPEDVEQRLAGRAAHGDPAARDELMAAHLRDVVDEAIAHRGPGRPVEFLVRRGMNGLVAATEQWDPARHPPFGTFVRRRIRSEVRASLLEH